MDDAYQVITLSAMGDAETPAGGSVCIRCAPMIDRQHFHFPIVGCSTDARRVFFWFCFFFFDNSRLWLK